MYCIAGGDSSDDQMYSGALYFNFESVVVVARLKVEFDK
jgi:hypothetical protein